MFGSWLKGPGKSSASSASRHGGDHYFHPRLEQLEDRSVPSTMQVIPNLPALTLASTILQNTTSKANSATLMETKSDHAGVFTNAKTIIGLNYGVVIGGYNVGILPGVYLNGQPATAANPATNTVLSFKFIPHGSVARVRIVMASDEYNFPGAFPDQVGVFVNGIQKAYLGGLVISPATLTFADPRVIDNGSVVPPFGLPRPAPAFPGAGSPFEIDAAGFTIPITLQFAVKPNVSNTLTFATSEGIDIFYPTWMFIEPLQVSKGPKIVAMNPYNWVYQPGSNAYLGIITIQNLGDTAFSTTAPHHLWVTLPGLPSGSKIISPAGPGYLPGTSIPAVQLPVLSINPGQVLSFQVLVTNPYNLALPSVFTAKPVVVIV